MPIRRGRAVVAAAVFAPGVLAASARADADAFTPGVHGFLDTGGNFTQIDVPGARQTAVLGINNAGQIVGEFQNNTGAHGFLDTGGSFTQIDVPGGSFTQAYGINNAGQIVGEFQNNTGAHGFLYTGGSFTQFDVPGAADTSAFGINDAGQIVGDFFNNTSPPAVQHGFLYTGGSFSQIDVPGAINISASGINNAGQIVGFFDKTDMGADHSFLDTSGSFAQIDVPGASDTLARGINNAGQIVGETDVSGGIGDPHFTTYYGVTYDFQGIGPFLLARSDVAGDQFDVEIRTGAWANGTSVIKGAAASLCNHDVTFDVNRAAAGSGFVWLDGSPISLSVGGSGLALGACQILESSPEQYQLVWDTGETLDIFDYGTWLAVSSQLSPIDGSGSVDGLLSSELDPDRWSVTGTASLFDPVPEPSSLALLGAGIGLTGLAIARRRKVSVKSSGLACVMNWTKQEPVYPAVWRSNTSA